MGYLDGFKDNEIRKQMKEYSEEPEKVCRYFAYWQRIIDNDFLSECDSHAL